MRGQHHDQKGNYRGPEEGYDLWDNVKEMVTVDTLWNGGECKVTVGHDWMNAQGYRGGDRKWAQGRRTPCLDVDHVYKVLYAR